MDVLGVPKSESVPSGYEIVTHGGRTHTGVDAIAWAKRGEALGAGELVVNSIDADGTRDGYELTLTRAVVQAVGIPVIASGGAGKPEHLLAVLTEAGADAALVASMLHYGQTTVSELKSYLSAHGIKVRVRH
jgi:cyclase